MSAGEVKVDGGGLKNDGDKVRLDLVPPEYILGCADILTFGAKKYAPRNWERGFAWGRAYGALQRHMLAWWGGENLDPETGKSHLWHAACCLSFLMAFEARPELRSFDDRPRRVAPEPQQPTLPLNPPVGPSLRDVFFGVPDGELRERFRETGTPPAAMTGRDA